MKKTAAVLALVVLLAPALCMAQAKGPSFSFSLLKPEIENTKMLNSAMLFNVQYPLNENLTVMATIPYAMWQPDIAGMDNESALGNPSVGVMGSLNESLGFHFAAGLPFASEELASWSALMVGMLASMPSYWHFATMSAFVEGGVDWWKMMDSGLGFFAGGGFSWVLPEEEGVAELYLPFYGGALYNLDVAMVGVGLEGHYWLSKGDVSADAIVWGLNLGAEFPLGAFTPHVYYTMPLNEDWANEDTGAGISSVIGIGFKYTIMK